MHRRRAALGLVVVATLAALPAPPLCRVHVTMDSGRAPGIAAVRGLELAALGGTLLVSWTADAIGR